MTPRALMQGAPGPETVIDGVQYLYFAGTSYLGLAGHPEVVDAGCSAMRRYGVHSATTRALVGTNPPVADVERRAAEYFGTEDAFYFGSGYMANHIMISALAANAEAVAVDEAAHYCVREAARIAGLPVLSFASGDAKDLARAIQSFARVLVAADAVGSTTGGLAPAREFIDVLQQRRGSMLLLDDAHGFGVLGRQGRGLFDELELWPHINGGPACDGVSLYVCGTLSKAMGGFGGIIPGTSQFVARARQGSHYFDGSSAPASAVAGATAKALEILLRDPSLRTRLRENVTWLRRQLRGLGLAVPDRAAANFGVAIGDGANMRRIHQALKGRGIYVPYVEAYAGIPPDGLLRFAVFANHTQAQMERLIAVLREVL